MSALRNTSSPGQCGCGPSAHDAAYIGWFGPIGVAAIYYAALAVERTGETAIWNATSAIVLASLLLHGLTATPLSRLYAAATRQR